MADPLGELAARLGSSGWAGLGILAALGLLLAAFRLVYVNLFLGLAVAAVLGAGSYLAFDIAWTIRAAELRRGPKRRPRTPEARELSLAPSFEVYDPRRAESAEAEVPPPSGE